MYSCGTVGDLLARNKPAAAPPAFPSIPIGAAINAQTVTREEVAELLGAETINLPPAPRPPKRPTAKKVVEQEQIPLVAKVWLGVIAALVFAIFFIAFVGAFLLGLTIVWSLA